MDLFDVMRNKTYLSPMNLLQLQGLLWSIKKHHLMNMVIDYAKESKDVAYLQPASRTPGENSQIYNYRQCMTIIYKIHSA